MLKDAFYNITRLLSGFAVPLLKYIQKIHPNQTIFLVENGFKKLVLTKAFLTFKKPTIHPLMVDGSYTK